MKTQWVLLVGLGSFLALGCLVAQAEKSAEQLEKEAEAFNKRLRADFQLPKIFDFARFKDAFHRLYNSALEEMVRAKLFMARAYRAFISAVKYKYRTAKYFLAVNSRADWTHEELEAALNHRLWQEEGPRATPIKPGQEADGEEHIEPLVKPEDLEAELKRIRAHKDLPGYKELNSELANMQPRLGSRRKRDLEVKRRSKSPRIGFQLREAYERHGGTGQAALGLRVRSNNPNYRQPDVASEMSLNEFRKLPGYRDVYWRNITSGYRVRNYSKLPIKATYINKDLPYLVSLTNKFATKVAKLFWHDGNKFSGNEWTSEPEGEGSDEHDDERDDGDIYDEGDDGDKSDVVWVDHRQGGCMQPVQDQGNCGSCYVFSTMAFYEWAYCNETGSPVKFSEQYVLDCGTKLDHLSGCDGGVVEAMPEFVNNFGLEMRRNYPYKAREEQCPYEPDTPLEHMGYMRVESGHLVKISLELVEEYLPNFPMLININTRGDFSFYGGGVYDGFWCQKQGTHSVLLIGHGREDGEEYWLIRNSHSTDYGEQGHLKLNKNSNCIHPMHAFAFGRLSGDRVRVYGERNRHVSKRVQKPTEAPVVPNAGVRRKNQQNDLFRAEMELAKRREAARRKREQIG